MSKTVLITGASRGIGAEMAKRYAAMGATVIGTYRSDAPDIPGVIWAKADVTDRSDLAALRAHIPGGKLDLLVANAGVYLDRVDELAKSVKGNSLIYRASKAACANAARNLSVELAPKGISVAAALTHWTKRPRVVFSTTMAAPCLIDGFGIECLLMRQNAPARP